MNPLTYVLVNGALAALLWSGAIEVQAGLLTQGAVVALVNYLSQILVELVKFANADRDHHQVHRVCGPY